MRRLEPVDELKEGLSSDSLCPTLRRNTSASVTSVSMRWTETKETTDIVKMWAGPRDEVYVRVWPAGLHVLEDFFLTRMIETDEFAESRHGVPISDVQNALVVASHNRRAIGPRCTTSGNSTNPLSGVNTETKQSELNAVP